MLKFISSLFGIGYLKSGGTIASIITHIIMQYNYLNLLSNIILFLIIYIISHKIIFYILKTESSKDPSYIVLDEVIGYYTGYILIFLFKMNLYNYIFLIYLFCFRLFDIFKPFGIKRIENINGPTGIIFDDIIAAIYALIIINIFYK